jgi:isoleucyl-tRNA synthetase
MSKSLGNVMDPWEVLGTRGADPLRWWMFSQGSPWTPTRGSMAAIDATTREMLLTLWNTFSFFMTYASLNGFDPSAPDVPTRSDRGELDRWAISRCEGTTKLVTESLDAYEPFAAATVIAELVDDVSNWYVRRSRRRFWRTDPSAPAGDALAAQATLHEVLTRISLLLAPMCPFLGEHLFDGLQDSAPQDSVHLSDWPVADETMIDPGLESKMASAREVVRLGRSARSEAGLKVRQPLRRALVFLPPGTEHPPADVVADELNVDHVEFTAALSDILAYELRPNFRSVGPKLGDRVRLLAPALGALDGAGAARILEAGGTIEVTLDGEAVVLSSEDVELRVRAAEGFAVSRKGAEVVALDLELDDELRRRGLVRELVRQVQDHRKARGLSVSDHIGLWVMGIELSGDERELVAREVLADEIAQAHGPGVAAEFELDDGVTVQVWLAVS